MNKKEEFVNEFVDMTNHVKDDMSRVITDANDYGWFKAGVESVIDNLKKWLDTNVNFYKSKDEVQDAKAN